jgi:c-di-GMP-binding flagellar brake protein YcgR
MGERRKHQRFVCGMKVIVTKTLPDWKKFILEFVLSDISAGGVFIPAEDLSLFDLCEELNIVITDAAERFYEGKALVVRSARVFSAERKPAQSGYGLKFVDAPPEFLTRIERRVAARNPITF